MRTYSHTQTYTHTLKHTLTHSNMHTHTHTCTHTCMYTHTHTQHTHTHIQVDVLVHTPVYKLLVHNIVRHENQSESAFLTCYLLLHYHTVEWCYTICMYTVYRTSTPNTYMHTPPPHKHTLNHPPPAHSAAWCRCSSPQTPSAYPSAPQTQQTRHW